MTLSRTYRWLALILTVASLAIACAAPKRTPPPSDDATIQIRVRTALQNAPNVHGNEIQVETTGAVVVLKGSVHGQAEEDAAIAVVRQVPGVREVRSELKKDRSGS
jgi:osmotically-inducible protein OsmY